MLILKQLLTSNPFGDYVKQCGFSILEDKNAYGMWCWHFWSVAELYFGPNNAIIGCHVNESEDILCRKLLIMIWTQDGYEHKLRCICLDLRNPGQYKPGYYWKPATVKFSFTAIGTQEKYPLTKRTATPLPGQLSQHSLIYKLGVLPNKHIAINTATLQHMLYYT